MAIVIDFIIIYGMDIQNYMVETLTPHFIFYNIFYLDIPQGAKTPPQEKAKKIKPSFKLLTEEKVKKSLEISLI